MRHNYSLKKLRSSPGAQFITHSALKFSEYVSNVTKNGRKAKYSNALNISVCDITIHWKKLRSSPGAQFNTYSALKFSAYSLNVTKKAEKRITIMH